ncbi:hypothetical protein DI487_08515 [Flavobacterium sediminis]|uniref:Uncharacterized protein n=1 Tax=Flavobacterium sediminis TaxID=2201181 RepID=A0A2U8QUL4_9FLAO|nr:hypothetical protein [Flavobacterium sediminis]AWM13900.1 hypothetical protein DI487_08515 [Flavobacterium sediminis]
MNLNEERIKEKNYSNSIKYLTTNQPTNTINNVTYGIEGEDCLKKPLFTEVTGHKFEDYYQSFNDTFPTYLSNCESITIPKKVKRAVSGLPKGVLNKIDKDKNVAIEKCLDFVSNFTGSIFYEEEEDKWRNLSSKYLDETYRKGKNNTYIYRYIIKALQYSTISTYPIIEIKKNEYGNESYLSNEFSKSYKLNSYFDTDSLVSYSLKNEDLISKKRKKHLERLSQTIQNPIGKNLLEVYKNIELPTNKQIEIKASTLIKDDFETKKGKLLTRLNNRKRENIKDFKNKSFVEDNIKQFNYLTKNGFFMPSIGDLKSGGRVVDSFTLMSSWIRELVIIDGEKIVEVDFKALHPNLAMKIYNGSTKFIKHQDLANTLGITLQEVKREHVSFFNRRISGMKRSPLYDYYNQYESELLKNIIADKKGSKYRHKVTSMKLFQLEVQIMTEVIQRLNKQEIYVLYIYDALGCKESEVDIVKKTMNEVILEFGVSTVAE